MSKDKNFIINYQIIKELENNKFIKRYNNEIIINKVKNKLNYLIEDYKVQVNKEFNRLINHIEYINEISFKNKYLDFKEIKNHTRDLEVIYNIIINLG